MQHFGLLAAALLLSTTAAANQTTVNADNYDATAYFTSGLVDGEPIDRIDSATLDQDTIVLYVDWERMRSRAYRTEVRIMDPNGRVVGRLRNIIRARTPEAHTYYFYRPGADDAPGAWTYQVYVDGRSAFEARIDVLAAE